MATRKDTPAARAALARRRQRAALNIQPSTSISSRNENIPVSKPPPPTMMINRSNNRPPMISKQQRPTSTINKPNLQITTTATDSSDYDDGHSDPHHQSNVISPPTIEVRHRPSRRLSPSARRGGSKLTIGTVISSNKVPPSPTGTGNVTVDGTAATIITEALTNATPSTTAHHSTTTGNNNNPESARQLLQHSLKLAENAQSVLDNVGSSSSSTNNKKRPPTTMTTTTKTKTAISTRTRTSTKIGSGTPTNTSSSLLQRYSSTRPVHRSLAERPRSPKVQQVQPSESNEEGGPLDARRKKLESSVVPQRRLLATSSSPPSSKTAPNQKGTTSLPPAQKTPPPPKTSTSDEHSMQDLLTASRQRRANLENKFKFNSAGAPAPAATTAATTNKKNTSTSLKGQPATTTAAVTKHTNIGIDTRQRNPSSPSKQNLNLPILDDNSNQKKPPRTTEHSSNDKDDVDPMSTTRRQENEESEEGENVVIGSTEVTASSTTVRSSPDDDHDHRVIPRRNTSAPRRQSPQKNISTKRYNNLQPPSPPSPPHQEQQQQQQRALMPPRSPRQSSQPKRSTLAVSSGGRNEEQTVMNPSTKKSPTKQQQYQELSSSNDFHYRDSSSPARGGRNAPSSQRSRQFQNVKGTQQEQQPASTEEAALLSGNETNNNSGNQNIMSGIPTNTARLDSTTTTPPRNYQYETSHMNGGRNSPGVERLSSYLLDTSSVNDISLIADTTAHHIEPPSPFHNQRFSSPPQQNRPSPHRRYSPRRQYNNHVSSPPPQLGISPRHYAPPADPNNIDDDQQHLDDDNNSYDDIDDQGTVDDEKLLTMDSACLKTGLTIMLRAYCNNSTIVNASSRSPDYNNDYLNNACLAEPSGLCLGGEEELMEVRKVTSNPNDSEDLRHGDTVVFYSLTVEGCSLGIQDNTGRLNNGTSMTSRLSLGFFPSKATVSDTWMILSARSDREVLLGRSAIAAKAPPPAQKGGSGMPAPVRSGDHVLIRNCYNGGILSVDATGNLVLLTDSYESQMHDDPSLMGRLQSHDRLYPSPRETFQLILSSTPPCPQWVTGRSKDERVYLTGSYILQPRRNQRNAEFESKLFADRSQTNSILYMEQHRHTPVDASNLSTETKEKILIDEVIGSFLGLEGRHIRLKGTKGHTSRLDNYEFQLFRADGVSFDISLTHLVEQILPLSTSYVRVRNFISSRHPGYEYGGVMHALCEGLDTLLQDYVTFVGQLERQHREYSGNGQLTMKNIYYQITPSLHTMSILEHATKEVCEKKGGDLINSLWLLEKRSYMGDAVAKKFLGILLDKASAPYMAMMSSWLQTGLLMDPYEEFMIRCPSDSKSKTKPIEMDGDAWMAMFEINETHVLKDVITNDWTKKKILTTGKYWNAVNACSVDQKSDYEEKSQAAYKIPKLSFNSDSSAISAYIDNMYQNASRVLMRLMMHNFKLMDSLRTARRYFLLDQGDFLMHFLDASEQELIKQAEDVSIGRVQHCLSMAVHLTEGYRDDVDSVAALNETQAIIDPRRLRCRFSTQSLVAHLNSMYGDIADKLPGTPSRQMYGMSNKGNTGIEVFQIEFPRIPFPVSLVLSHHAMDNYKLLFRHLFFTKHVERRLISVWRDHQVLKKLDSVRGLLGPTFLLRQRMLHFVQNLIYYMTFEVIDSNWVEMTSSIDNSTDPMAAPQSQRHHTVDDILNVHDEFLNKTLEACLLSNKGLIRSLVKLLNTCLLYTEQMRRFMDATKIHHDSKNLAAEKRGAIQRSLNERGTSQFARDKRKLHHKLVSLKEERANHQYRQTRKVGREVSSESYKRMVSRFDEVFNADLADFMMQLNSHTATGLVANLGIRLDYNGYVTSAIASNNRF